MATVRLRRVRSAGRREERVARTAPGANDALGRPSNGFCQPYRLCTGVGGYTRCGADVSVLVTVALGHL